MNQNFNHFVIFVLNGFLGAVGFKVLKAALTTSVGTPLYKHPEDPKFWILLMPAIPIGIMLWLHKRYHWKYMVPTIYSVIFGPLLVFYII